jgi:site-specific recombinase XerD
MSRDCVLDALESYPVPLIDKKRHRFYFDMPDWGAGYNKNADESTLEAINDWDAVLEFLKSYRESKNSYIAYTASLEKFMLWLLAIKKKTLSELKYNDFPEYFDFLKKPSPASYWVGVAAKKTTKDGSVNPLWRPFVGKFKNDSGFDFSSADKNGIEANVIDYGLKSRAITSHSTMLGALFRFLFEKGHIKAMPMAPHRQSKNDEQLRIESVLERLLPNGAIEDIIDILDADEQDVPEYSPDHFNIIRNRFIIKMFYTTGLRLSELPGAYFHDIKDRPNKTYELMIVGKGGRLRAIRLYDDSIDAIKEFRSYFLKDNPFINTQNPGFSKPNKYSFYQGRMPSRKDDATHPLIPQIDLLSRVSDRRIAQLIKPVFIRLAENYESKARTMNPDSDEFTDYMNRSGRLSKASAHWIRHTHATNFACANKDNIKAVKERLGHVDLNTTMIYIHVVDKYFSHK